jgi:hypothetical protein
LVWLEAVLCFGVVIVLVQWFLGPRDSWPHFVICWMQIRIDSDVVVLARFRVVGSVSRCLNDILRPVAVLSSYRRFSISFLLCTADKQFTSFWHIKYQFLWTLAICMILENGRTKDTSRWLLRN